MGVFSIAVHRVAFMYSPLSIINLLPFDQLWFIEYRVRHSWNFDHKVRTRVLNTSL
jgi:hypothetical protein